MTSISMKISKRLFVFRVVNIKTTNEEKKMRDWKEKQDKMVEIIVPSNDNYKRSFVICS